MPKAPDGLLDRIVESATPSVIKAYEQRIEALEKDKLIAQEKLTNGAKPLKGFDDLFELTGLFLANPYKLWQSRHIALQRTVLRLAYSQATGLRTPEKTLLFNRL